MVGHKGAGYWHGHPTIQLASVQVLSHTGFHLSSHTLATPLHNFTNRFSSLHLIPPTVHITMSSHDEIISSSPIDLEAEYLHPCVFYRASPELRKILDRTFQSMTPQLKQELWAKPPTGTHERTQVIDMWITRLNVIKSGLASFPMLIDGGGTGTTTQSLAITPPADGATQAQQAGPSQTSIIACLERDQYECIMSGRKVSDGSGTEVVPIIPFAFANHPRCRDLDFWKMLEMFYGSEAIDNVFAGLLERVNSLENLVTLDNSIHAMFNSGALTLTPGTATWDPIPVINDYTGGYWLDIRCDGLPYSEYIQSTKGLSTGEVRILYPWSRITIACHEAMPGHASTLPLPSYFALRAFVLSLKNFIAEEPLPYDAFAPTSGSLTPSFFTPVEYWNQYPIHSPTSGTHWADPVLAASAILQALVVEGALERSP